MNIKYLFIKNKYCKKLKKVRLLRVLNKLKYRKIKFLIIKFKVKQFIRGGPQAEYTKVIVALSHNYIQQIRHKKKLMLNKLLKQESVNNVLLPVSEIVKKKSFLSRFFSDERLEELKGFFEPTLKEITSKNKTFQQWQFIFSLPFAFFLFFPKFIINLIWWFWKKTDISLGLEIFKFQFFVIVWAIFCAIIYNDTIYENKPLYTFIKFDYSIEGNGNSNTVEPFEFGGVFCDAAEPNQYGFQDSATPIMESIINLHDHIFFFLIIIMVGVIWVMGIVLKLFATNNTVISHKYLNHGTIIEILWTITPAFILISIAFPSFKLLYLMDEVIDPGLTYKSYWTSMVLVL